MKKQALTTAVDAAKNETRSALRTLWDALNQGQQKKLLKNEAVSALLRHHGIA